MLMFWNELKKKCNIITLQCIYFYILFFFVFFCLLSVNKNPTLVMEFNEITTKEYLHLH